MRKKPPVDWTRIAPTGSQVWTHALRTHGNVANDNGHGYRRRAGDQQQPPILHLSVAAPKAS